MHQDKKDLKLTADQAHAVSVKLKQVGAAFSDMLPTSAEANENMSKAFF